MLQSRVLNFCIYDEASRRDRTIFRCLRVTGRSITLSRVKRILSEKEDIREEKQKERKKKKGIEIHCPHVFLEKRFYIT